MFPCVIAHKLLKWLSITCVMQWISFQVRFRVLLKKFQNVRQKGIKLGYEWNGDFKVLHTIRNNSYIRNQFQIREMRERNEEVYHLAFGQSPFPIPDCFVKSLKEYAHRNEYLPVAGTEILHFEANFDSSFDCLATTPSVRRREIQERRERSNWRLNAPSLLWFSDKLSSIL